MLCLLSSDKRSCHIGNAHEMQEKFGNSLINNESSLIKNIKKRVSLKLCEDEYKKTHFLTTKYVLKTIRSSPTQEKAWNHHLSTNELFRASKHLSLL
jgi:hypothetical protein